LFPAQKKALLDRSIFRCNLSSRRGGKTTLSLYDLIITADEALQPGICLFLGLTNPQVEKNGYIPFKKILKDLGYIEGKHYKKNDSKMQVTFLHNDVIVDFVGADHPKVIETFRGTKYYLVIIDEAGSFRNDFIDKLIDEVIGPALGDVNGRITMQGTPPPVPNTAFEQAYNDEGWSSHYWTFRDNPYIRDNLEQVLAAIKKKRGWTDSHPVYRREYMGEFVYDSSRLLLKFCPQKNIAAEVPAGPVKKYLGVDFGYRDSMAYVVLYEIEDCIYLVHEYKKAGVTPTEFANELKLIMEKENITYGDTAADYGGLGRAILKDYSKHHDLHLQDAVKSGKGNSIEITNELLMTSRFKILQKNYKSIKEFAETEKDPKRPDLPLEGQEDHLLDSSFYAVRNTDCYNYQKSEEVTEEDKMYEEVIEQDTKRENEFDPELEPELYEPLDAVDAWL
jgi:hypothetical protein